MSAIRKLMSPPEIREPLLRLVDRAAVRSEARRRLIFTVSIGAVVIALFAVALIQARLVQTQRDVDGLYSQIEEVEAVRAQLANEVVHAESPDGIIARAIELGMVQAQQPVHLEAVRGPRTPGAIAGGSEGDGEPAEVGNSLDDVLDPLPGEGEGQ